MKIKILTLDADSLSGRQMYAIMRLRQDVFFIEEDINYADLDDYDLQAMHVMAVAEDDEDSNLAAYARIYKEEETTRVKIGRVVTAARYRGKGLGEKVVKGAINVARNHFKAHEVWLDAQMHVIEFYKRLGFRQVSEPFIEAGIKHVSMVLSLPEL